VIVGRANGTTFLEISKSNFRPIPVAAPPTDAMKAFDAHVRPMYNRVVANTRQSRTLAAIRDTLLPKLMSGEVAVKEGL
jgi:type I restriction enzyme S subunit